MKKIIKLSESDLTRIVKRVINEMESCDANCVWKKLRNHYEPKGFEYSTDPDGNEMLSKGEDETSSYVQYYPFNNGNDDPEFRGVFRYGKPPYNSTTMGTMSASETVVNKVYSKITSII